MNNMVTSMDEPLEFGKVWNRKFHSLKNNVSGCKDRGESIRSEITNISQVRDRTLVKIVPVHRTVEPTNFASKGVQDFGG